MTYYVYPYDIIAKLQPPDHPGLQKKKKKFRFIITMSCIVKSQYLKLAERRLRLHPHYHKLNPPPKLKQNTKKSSPRCVDQKNKAVGCLTAALFWLSPTDTRHNDLARVRVSCSQTPTRREEPS